MANRPILASSCARATTAAEARFRVEILPRLSWRSSRVFGLDTSASAVVDRIAKMSWNSARFYTVNGAPSSGDILDVSLQTLDGSTAQLSDELADADLVVLIARSNEGADAATAIGMAASARGLMTAGLVLDGGSETDLVVSALRPYARVLMITQDEHDVAEILAALRA